MYPSCRGQETYWFNFQLTSPLYVIRHFEQLPQQHPSTQPNIAFSFAQKYNTYYLEKKEQLKVTGKQSITKHKTKRNLQAIHNIHLFLVIVIQNHKHNNKYNSIVSSIQQLFWFFFLFFFLCFLFCNACTLSSRFNDDEINSRTWQTEFQ